VPAQLPLRLRPKLCVLLPVRVAFEASSVDLSMSDAFPNRMLPRRGWLGHFRWNTLRTDPSSLPLDAAWLLFRSYRGLSAHCMGPASGSLIRSLTFLSDSFLSSG